MRISDIKTHIVETTLSKPFVSSIGDVVKLGACFVELITDTRLVGWGEYFGPAHPASAMVDTYKP